MWDNTVAKPFRVMTCKRKGGNLSRPAFFVDRPHLLGRLFARLANGNGLADIAHFEACEALDRDVLAQLADDSRDELRHGDSLIFDERLLVEADLLVELAHLAFDNLLDHRCGLAALRGLRAIDVLFLLEIFRSDVFLADKLGIAGSDVHGDVVYQALEVVGAGHEIALAVYFHQHADLASGVDVAGDRAFTGDAGGLLGSGRHTLLAKDNDGAFHVAL